MRFTAINQSTSAADDARNETLQVDSAKQRQAPAAKTREALESEAFQKYNEALELERAGEHMAALKTLQEISRCDIVNTFMKKLLASEKESENNSQRSQVADPAFSRLCYLVYKNMAFIQMDQIDSATADSVGNELVQEAYVALSKALKIDDSDPICWLRLGKFSSQQGMPEVAYMAYRRVAECGERHNMSGNRTLLAELLKLSLAFQDAARCLATVETATRSGAFTGRQDDALLYRASFCVRYLLNCFALTEDELSANLKPFANQILPDSVQSKLTLELETLREQLRKPSPFDKPAGQRTVDFSSLRIPLSRASLADTNALAQATVVLHTVLKEYGDAAWTAYVDLGRLLAFLERASLAATADKACENATEEAPAANVAVKVGSKRKWTFDERLVEKRRSTRTKTAETAEETAEEEGGAAKADKKGHSAKSAAQNVPENERFADRLMHFLPQQLLTDFNERVASLRGLPTAIAVPTSTTLVPPAPAETNENESQQQIAQSQGCADSELTAFVAWCNTLRNSSSLLFIELVNSYLLDFLGRSGLRRVRIASSGVGRRAFVELMEAFLSSNSLQQLYGAYVHDLSTLSALVNVTLVYQDCWLQQADSKGSGKVAAGAKDDFSVFYRSCDCVLDALGQLQDTVNCEQRNAYLLVQAECCLMRSRAEAQLDIQRNEYDRSRFLYDCLREASVSEDQLDSYFACRARDRLAEMTVHALLLNALRSLELFSDCSSPHDSKSLALQSFLTAYISCEDNLHTSESPPSLSALCLDSLRRVHLLEVSKSAESSWKGEDGESSWNDLVTLLILDAVGGVLQRNVTLTRLTAERFEKVLVGMSELATQRISQLESGTALRKRYDSALCNWLRLAVEHLHASVQTNSALQLNLLTLAVALLRPYPTSASSAPANLSMPRSVAEYAALLLVYCLRMADSPVLGRVCRKVACNRPLWMAFYGSLTASASPSLLSLVHDYLGHSGECRLNAFELPRLAVRRLRKGEADSDTELQQAYSCLFGTDLCSAFRTYSAHTALAACEAHRCDDGAETFSESDADLLFRFVDFFRFSELPEYDSYKSLSATSEIEQFIRRVLHCTPAALVQYGKTLTDRLFQQLLLSAANTKPPYLQLTTSVPTEEKTEVQEWCLQNWVFEQLVLEPLPEYESESSAVSLEMVAELHFLIGDYLVKNTEFNASLTFLRSAAAWCSLALASKKAQDTQRLIFIKFNTWALLALAQQGLIDARLAETASNAVGKQVSGTSQPVTVPTLELAHTRLAFEQALRCCADSSPDDIAQRNEDWLKLAAEYAAFLYVVHSYASRTVKLTVCGPPNTMLIALGDNMLRRAQSALSHFLDVCQQVANAETDSVCEKAEEIPMDTAEDSGKSEDEHSSSDEDAESSASEKRGKRQAHAENELWLAYYLLGKCAEKSSRHETSVTMSKSTHEEFTRSPVERAISLYTSALRQVERYSPKHPKVIRRTFAVPARFSVESIELFFRITKLVLDRLLQLLKLGPLTEGERDEAALLELKYLEETLREIRECSFVKAHSFTVHEAGSSELVGLGLLLRPTASPSAATSSVKGDCESALAEVCDVVATLADLTDFASRIAPILECVTNLELCISRFPKYFKAHVRLACYYTMLSDSLRSRAKSATRGVAQLHAHADTLVSLASQHLIGMRLEETSGGLFAAKSKGSAKSNALFSERRPNNLFNGVWMLPIQDLDRPGSFISALYRASCLLLDVLYRCRSLNALDEVYGVLHAATQSDSQRAERTYMRDFELNCLLIRTVHRYAALVFDVKRTGRLGKEALDALLVRLCVMLPVFESSCTLVGCSRVPEAGSSAPECSVSLPSSKTSFVNAVKKLAVSFYSALRGDAITSSSLNDDTLWQMTCAYATMRSSRANSSKPPAVRKQSSVNPK